MENYKKLLKKFVSFKSISTDPKFSGEIKNVVDWLKNLFITSDFRVKVLSGKTTNPIVLASYTKSPKFKTVLIYGHYDVQPAEKSDGWSVQPFALSRKGGKFLGRGAADNKGQIMVHICTALELIKTNSLKYNVKFLIEGNEETGNADISATMQKFKKELKCDLVLISDGELTNNSPTIEVSLRGGFNATLAYKTGKNNLHSGIFGGAVPNANHELVLFLANLMDGNRVLYTDFYSGADKPKQAEVLNNKDLVKSGGDLAKLAGVRSLLLPKNTDFYTATGLMPTIQISGIKGGYVDTGYANIVPADAEVKLNFRIVSSQKAKDVASSFKRFVAENTPKYVDWKLSFSGLHNPVKINTDNEFVRIIEPLLKSSYRSKVNRKNVGGAIPIVADVKEVLGVDAVLVPFANEDCNMHGTDENFDIGLIKKALSFSKSFLGDKK